MAPQREDLTGRTFGWMTALSFVGADNGGKAIWKCRCACGTEKEARAPDLKLGKIKSCGCKLRMHKKKFGKRLGGFYAGGMPERLEDLEGIY